MKPSEVISNTIHYLNRLASDEAIAYQTRRDCLFQEVDRLEKLRKEFIATEEGNQ